MPDSRQVIAGLISSYFGMLRGQDTYFQVNILKKYRRWFPATPRARCSDAFHGPRIRRLERPDSPPAASARLRHQAAGSRLPAHLGRFERPVVPARISQAGHQTPKTRANTGESRVCDRGLRLTEFVRVLMIGITSLSPSPGFDGIRGCGLVLARQWRGCPARCTGQAAERGASRLPAIRSLSFISLFARSWPARHFLPNLSEC